MLLQLPDVLEPEQIAHLRARLAATSGLDEQPTVGKPAVGANCPEQLHEDSPVARELANLILDALSRNSTFFAAALPHRIYPPRLHRCCAAESGHSQGSPLEAAIRYDRRHGRAEPIRSDICVTVFLSEPHSYDGGQLVIDDTYGQQQVKLPAGHALIYPGNGLQRILPVTRGERLAAIFWVQSMVRDASQRRTLFDLDVAIRQLTRDVAQHPALVSLTGVYHNLLRRWADV